MVVVAVAGGTGGVGRAIVDALVHQGKHEVKIFSRKRDAAKESELGACFVPVDYNDITGLAKTLEDEKVHTVISAINMMLEWGGPANELNLIKAADASKTTKRMISSDWGMDHPIDDKDKLSSIGQKLAAWDVLMDTKDLEWTIFRNGFFMDYWGMPKVKSHMAAMIVRSVDMANNMAALPGDGTTPVAFTHTSDVGKYVAASLDLDKWDHVSYVVGDKVTWNEFAKLAQEAKGTQFKVVYDPIEKMEKGEVTELPGEVSMYQFFPKEQLQLIGAAFGLWFAKGLFNIDENKALNKKLPEVRPLKVKDMLQQAWGAPN